MYSTITTKRFALNIALLLFIVSFCFAFASPVTVRAAGSNPLWAGCNSNGSSSEVCSSSGVNPPDVITGADGIVLKVARIIGVVVGVASILMILLGGFTYIKSSGDAQQVKAAKDTIMYAVIGLVVALLAQFVVAFVIQKVL